MKKKIFGVAIIAAMAVAASWSFSQSQNNKNNISLISTDIEAGGIMMVIVLRMMLGPISANQILGQH